MECDRDSSAVVDDSMEIDDMENEGKMWRFSQLKGVIDPTAEEMPAEADMITAVQFNHDGELLATGDRGGRIVIFQQNHVKFQNY